MKMPEVIVGIDPGVSNGGIAIWKKGEPVKVVRMDRDLGKLNEYFAYISENYPDAVVFLEGINIFGSDADTPGKNYRIKKLTDHHAQLKAYLTYQKLQYVIVYPISWQTTLKLKKKYVSDKEKKNAFKEYAQNCFPEVKVTGWSADALCLVQFALRAYEARPSWIKERLQNEISQNLFN